MNLFFHILRNVGLALMLIGTALLVASFAHAQTDPYADHWFTYEHDATTRLDLRYALTRSGATLYVKHWELDPGDVPRSLVLGQFSVACAADGVAPAAVRLQRVTTLNPLTNQAIDDARLGGAAGTLVPVTPTEPLGRIVAIVCAAHAYAVHALR